MECREYREGHPAEPEEARAHLESCPDCRSFRRTWDLIREYPAIEPGPGFARGLRSKIAPPILKFGAPIAAMAAALMVAVVLFLVMGPGADTPETLTEEQRELAENLELLENLDLLRALEFVGDGVSPILENPK